MAGPNRQLKPPTNRTEQHVLNSSFDELYQVQTVLLLGERNGALYRVQVDSDGNIVNNPGTYALKTTIVGSVTYIAKALPGTTEASALWQVQKIVESAGGDRITWADGDANFDNVATDLTTLTYS